MKKYRLNHDERHPQKGYEHLRRIIAERPIPDLGIAKGDTGGWVRSEENLSQEGDCWIWPDAIATDAATVREQAQLKDVAIVCDEADLSGECVVGGASQIRERAQIGGKAVVGRAFERTAGLLNQAIYQRAVREKIIEKVEKEKTYDAVVVREHACVGEFAEVTGDVVVKGTAIIRGKARVEGNTTLVVIGGTARLGGTVRAYGEAFILEGTHESGHIRN